MSIEVNCPSCGGSIQIEAVSEIVACPLCQMHLQVDPESNEPVLVSEENLEEEANAVEAVDPEPVTNASELDESQPTPPEAGIAAPDEPGSSENESDSASPFSFLPGGIENKSSKKQPDRPATNFSFLPGGSAESESETAEPDVAEPKAEGEAVDTAGATTTDIEPSEETVEVPDTTGGAADSTDAEPEMEAVASEEAATAESDEAEPAIEESTSGIADPGTSPVDQPEQPAGNALEEVAAESTETETNTETTGPVSASQEAAAQPTPPSYRREKVVSKRVFTLTLTYAIAVTAMLAMLLYAKYQGDPHQLESLPDLKPPIKNDEIALQLVPENATLPPGHVLQLGGPGRRFGNVLVTPLRVTRGPLEFEHYTGDTSLTREPTGDVLKLYLKFENVSDDQTFEPLDQKLLLTRVSGNDPEAKLRANNFLSSLEQKQTDGNRVLLYDMPPSWEWNIKGQNINQEKKPQELKPGESFETFVATNEQGIDDLQGELVWRLQIRKGYNPQSYQGVTTLIEVVFNSSQIQTDMISGSKDPQPTT
ncbi:hypothetical protein [Gimesia algae]|uniref:Uncharacterized protein n=1 Tax=Gimesia algae TaxID=2527971 RepID=A0A517VLX6_9PLAN|nr:hypothetical protein [Gimesia algae]QDT93975.1 hypothetical protein Pan161_56620 [Gimesia algae]